MYVALDPTGITGHGLPTGIVVGMHKTLQGLRNAGFAAGTYTGNRLVNVDESTAAWDKNATIGWYWESSALKQSLPLSDVERLHASLVATHNQILAWDVGIDEESTGQPNEKVEQGHDILWRALGGMYLLARDTTYTVAQRIAWCDSVRTGAANVQSVHAFYLHFHGTATDNWLTWVNPADATKLNLESSQIVAGTVPDAVILTNQDWIELITA